MKTLFSSRKFVVLAISLVATVLSHASGIEISADQVEVMAGLVCAWIVGQGIADAGGGGTTRI